MHTLRGRVGDYQGDGETVRKGDSLSIGCRSRVNAVAVLLQGAGVDGYR